MDALVLPLSLQQQGSPTFTHINTIPYTLIPMGRPSTSEKQSGCTTVPKESLAADATHHMRLCRVAGGVGGCWDVQMVDWSKNTMQTHVDPLPDRQRCLFIIVFSPLSPVKVQA